MLYESSLGFTLVVETISSRSEPPSTVSPAAACASFSCSAITFPPSSFQSVRRRSVALAAGARRPQGLLAFFHPELFHEPFALRRILQQLFDLLAERRHVRKRAFQRGQRFPQVEHLLQLGHLLRDGRR